MPETDRITIDAARCNGDGLCVAVCPADVFQAPPPEVCRGLSAPRASTAPVEDNRWHPTVARPELCIRCGHCVAVCPTSAVAVHGVRVSEFPTDGAEPPVSPDDLLALLTRRRSVRRMSDQSVPREAVQQVIQAASTAPTAKNARAVRVTVIQDAALRAKLVQRCLAVYRGLGRRLDRLMRWRFLPFVSRERLEVYARVRPAFRRLIERLEAGEDVILFEAPVTVVLSAPEALGTSACDCSYALMNAALMAETLGLGTCIMGYFMEAARRDAEMRRLMALPDYEQVYGAFTLGYAAYPIRRQIDRRRFRTNWL